MPAARLLSRPFLPAFLRGSGRRAQAFFRWLGLSAFLGAASLAAAVWDVDVTPGPGDNFDVAQFRLWLDDARASAAGPVRALLVLAPGWNGDGRALAADPEWQALARRLDAGIVAVYLRTEPKNEDDARRYHQAHLGSGAALARALERLAKASGRPEIARAPWLAWGHSAGGQWVYGLASVFPDQVAAFVATKGGIYETAFDVRAREVPGLFVVGENDEIRRAIGIHAVFERERRAGAFWALAWEKGSGHEVGNSLGLARSFLLEAALLRLPVGGSPRLQPIQPAQGWTGDRATYGEARARPAGEAALARTVWLPGPNAARLWAKLGGGIEAGE